MKMLLDHELQQRRYRSHDVTYYHNMHELCAFQKAKVASQTRLSYLKKAGPQLCIHESRFIHDNVPTTTRHRIIKHETNVRDQATVLPWSWFGYPNHVTFRAHWLLYLPR